MAITNLTELIEVLKTDPTLQSVAVTRDGTSITQLRVNPISSGITQKATTDTVTVTAPVIEFTVVPPRLSPVVVNNEQGITNELLVGDLDGRLTDLDGRLTVLEGDYATQAYVDSAISGIVDGAPGVLDTLNEIAASLGDEPNFAFSINSRLDSKANIQDPIFFGTVTTDSITIDNNVISTNITNASLELEASGTGQILAKSNLTVGFGGNLVVTSGNTFLNTLIPYTASGVNIQGSTSFTAGVVNFQSVSQTIVPLTGATGVVTHNLSNGAVFFHSSISANFTANFTNVPTTDDRGIGVALVLDQGGTGYLPTAVQINGASVTLRWAYNTVPTPSSSQIDTVSFTLIRTGATWYVIGQHTNFA